jgi:diguanylate cyclase (GGDEF)-like protein
MRDSDFMARSGGDDFSVILPNADLNGARVVAERIRAAITRIQWSKREITVSVGVSVMIPSADANQTLLVAQAAEALAHAKRAGRNKVEVFRG